MQPAYTDQLAPHHVLDPAWSYEGLPIPGVNPGDGKESFFPQQPEWTMRISGLVAPIRDSSKSAISSSGGSLGKTSILDAPPLPSPLGKMDGIIQGARVSMPGLLPPLQVISLSDRILVVGCFILLLSAQVDVNARNQPQPRYSEAGVESYNQFKPIGPGNLLSTVQQIVSRPPQQFVPRSSVSGSPNPRASQRLRSMISDAGEDLGGSSSGRNTVNIDELLAYKRVGL